MVVKRQNGSTNIKPFKLFQIRWAEKLGLVESPYLIRWTFLFLGYSIRIHHWLKSDDDRFFHDHSANFVSILLKGSYDNITPIDSNGHPFTEVWSEKEHKMVRNIKAFHVEGLFNSWKHFKHFSKSIWKSKATDKHYLRVPKEGAWTLMFEGKPYNKWGFYIGERKFRPLRYFHKYGIRQVSSYQ